VSEEEVNMGKHESGSKKRNRKEKQDELVQSQRGAMDKFVKKKPQLSSGNESADPPTYTL
jgi:hypothetical protein